ncbi:hypothetical protein [Jiella sp. M17.18]|uniref:hypothetical protein n=1 Tax=Jiella sp. M17.18 TaxID=3234247 RepID=UPI0034DEB810
MDTPTKEDHAMTPSETLDAYESGLITEEEAVEQAMVDDIDELYAEVSGSDGRHFWLDYTGQPLGAY